MAHGWQGATEDQRLNGLVGDAIFLTIGWGSPRAGSRNRSCGKRHRHYRRPSMALERALGLWRDGIDRFALRPAIGMIDPIPLIVAAQKAGADQVRYDPAHIRPSRSQYSRLNFLFELPFHLFGIGHIARTRHQIGVNRIDHGATPTIPLCERRQRLAKPVTDRHPPLAAADIRSHAVVGTRFLSDQLQHQQCIAGPLRHRRYAFDKIGKRGRHGQRWRPGRRR